MKLSRLLLFPALLLTITAHAQIDNEKLRHKLELDALKGLKDFSINVVIQPGFDLSESEIKHAVELRCRRKGAPVAGQSHLVLTAYIRPKSDPRLKGYAIALSVQATQVIHFERTDTLEQVILWRRDDVVVSDKEWTELRASLAQMVDEFASDFLVANPETYKR
jgi:hypothetical protein